MKLSYLAFLCTASATFLKCDFLNLGYFYTDNNVTFANGDSECSVNIGEMVEVNTPNTSKNDLHAWLHFRRGLRACGIRRAFAKQQIVLAKGGAQYRPCIVSPGGVTCMDVQDLDPTLELPVLCHTII